MGKVAILPTENIESPNPIRIPRNRRVRSLYIAMGGGGRLHSPLGTTLTQAISSPIPISFIRTYMIILLSSTIGVVLSVKEISMDV